MIEDFHRIKRLPPYVFAEVNRLKAAARAGGADIIDLGMGNPDMPTPQHIIDKLVETVGKPRTNRYSASKGIAGLRQGTGRLLCAPLRREAQSRDASGGDAWDPRKASPTWRRRSARPATSSWCPSPTYPIHEFGFIISGAAIRHIPDAAAATRRHATRRHEFLRGVERAVKHSIPGRSRWC